MERYGELWAFGEGLVRMSIRNIKKFDSHGSIMVFEMWYRRVIDLFRKEGGKESVTGQHLPHLDSPGSSEILASDRGYYPGRSIPR